MENNTNNTGNGAATSSEDATISTQATFLDKKKEEEEEEEDGILGMMMMNEEDEEEQEEPVLSNNSQHDNKRDALYPFGDDVSPIGRQVMIKYEDNTYYPGTIRSYDPNGTYTIKWEDGSLQSSTLPEDIKWDVEQKKITTPAAVITETPVVVVADELWLAARRGSIASVKRFVETEKIHYDHDGGSGRTPFYWAVLCGHLQVTEFLISLGAKDPDGTAFAGASKPEMRELLKKNNLSPDSKKEVKAQNQEEEEEEEEPIRIVDAEMGRKSIHRNSFAFPRRASITTTEPEPEAIKSEDPKPVSIMNDVVPVPAPAPAPAIIVEKTQIVKTKTSSFNFTRFRLRLWDRFLLPFRRHRRDKKNP